LQNGLEVEFLQIKRKVKGVFIFLKIKLKFNVEKIKNSGKNLKKINNLIAPWIPNTPTLS
jgi:hypothetical protein